MRATPIALSERERTTNQLGLKDRAVAAVADHPVLSVFTLALLVRVVIAVFVSGFFSGSLVLDDATYHTMAVNMAAEDISHWDAFTYNLYWSTATFMLPVTAIYELVGPVKVVAQLFVALLGAGAAALTTRLGLEVLKARWAIAAGLIVALLPSQALWSSLLMKDAAVWLVLTGFAVVVALAGRSTGRRLLFLGGLAALLLVMLSFLRPHTAVVAAWALMLAAWAGIAAQRNYRVAGALVLGITIPWFAVGIGPAGLTLVTNAGSLQERRLNNAVGANTAVVDPRQEQAPAAIQAMGALERKVNLLESRARLLLARADEAQKAASARPSEKGPRPSRRGDAAPRRKVDEQDLRRRAERLQARAGALRERLAAKPAPPAPPPQPSDEGFLGPNISYLPRGLSVMLFEPLPWPPTGSASLRMARAESVIWYPILILAAIGLVAARRHLRVALFPALAGGAILVMYALTEGNLGTAHRHRGEFVWAVALFAGFGLAQLARWRAARRTSSGSEARSGS